MAFTRGMSTDFRENGDPDWMNLDPERIRGMVPDQIMGPDGTPNTAHQMSGLWCPTHKYVGPPCALLCGCWSFNLGITETILCRITMGLPLIYFQDDLNPNEFTFCGMCGIDYTGNEKGHVTGWCTCEPCCESLQEPVYDRKRVCRVCGGKEQEQTNAQSEAADRYRVDEAPQQVGGMT